MNPKSKQFRLFCFPYAGGNEYIFRNWEKSLPDFVEVRAVSLPGRGVRIHHEPYRDLSRLVNDLAMERQLFVERPFAFFGHSMGALISFELARAVRDRYRIQPAKLFVSGRGAPHLPHKRPPVHDQPAEEIRTVLRELNGTPPEILENDEMMKLALPLLRADLQVVETYKCEPSTPLTCPIAGFTGTEDADVTDADMQAWQMHTSGRFTLDTFSGDHFFIKTAETQVLARLSQELMQAIHVTGRA
ncbi:MAG TPA: alpha/beta fold hydrolase [Candidatus Angelobacter sp.]|jgi:medium-chain acyl-[acyl-carrier-protein] hydrolase